MKNDSVRNFPCAVTAVLLLLRPDIWVDYSRFCNPSSTRASRIMRASCWLGIGRQKRICCIHHILIIIIQLQYITVYIINYYQLHILYYYIIYQIVLYDVYLVILIQSFKYRSNSRPYLDHIIEHRSSTIILWRGPPGIKIPQDIQGRQGCSCKAAPCLKSTPSASVQPSSKSSGACGRSTAVQALPQKKVISNASHAHLYLPTINFMSLTWRKKRIPKTSQ